MARILERKFDPALDVFARKYFTANGHRFQPGDKFDWRKMSVSQRRVMQMFESGKIANTPSAKKKVSTEPKYTPKAIKEEYTLERKDTALESLDYYDSSVDDLDAIEDMKELRAIADEIGAGYKVSKVDQRQAIRDKRTEL